MRVDKKAHDLATYLHVACFSPSKSTFIKAIQNNFLLSCLGLTTHLIKKHLSTSFHTELGHIKAERQALRSTKPPKTHESIYTIIHNSDKTFMGLTGRFPYKSSRGNEYVLIVYHLDSNAILGTTIKSRQASAITQAWIQLENILSNCNASTNT